MKHEQFKEYARHLIFENGVTPWTLADDIYDLSIDILECCYNAYSEALEDDSLYDIVYHELSDMLFLSDDEWAVYRAFANIDETFDTAYDRYAEALVDELRNIIKSE